MSAIAFDPLIAEAKERARRRRLLAFGALAIVAAGALTYGLLPSGRSGEAGSQTLPKSLIGRLAVGARERVPVESALYAGGVDAVTTGNGDALYSVNGGRTWHRHAADSSLYEPVVFVNRRDGWIQTGEFLDRTTDGGRSWTRLPLPVYLGPYSTSNHVSNVTFVNRRDGFLGVFQDHAGGGRLFVTRDGGKTWQARGTFLPPQGIGFDGFTNARTGFALRYPDVYATRDAGRTWSVVLRGPSCGEGFWAQVEPGFAVVQCGRSLHVSSDGGSSWTVRRAPAYVVSLDILGARTWVAQCGSTVFATKSAGRSWRMVGRLVAPANWEINAEFTSLRTAQALFGRESPQSPPTTYVLMRTTDAGKHWTAAGPLKPKRHGR